MKVILAPRMNLKSIINHSVCNNQTEKSNEILVKSTTKNFGVGDPSPFDLFLDQLVADHTHS